MRREKSISTKASHCKFRSPMILLTPTSSLLISRQRLQLLQKIGRKFAAVKKEEKAEKAAKKAKPGGAHEEDTQKKKADNPNPTDDDSQ